MIESCPGSRQFKKPHPEEVRCIFCAEDVEIWTDEFSAQCPKCGRAVSRTGQSCLDWCKAARECVGDEVYGSYIKNRRGK